MHYHGATKNRAKKFPVKTNEEEKTTTYKKQIIHMPNYEFDTKIPIEKKNRNKKENSKTHQIVLLGFKDEQVHPATLLIST